MNNEAQTSSIVTKDVTQAQKGQFEMPTWGIVIGLILFFFILKSFIYIRDTKRHGK